MLALVCPRRHRLRDLGQTGGRSLLDLGLDQPEVRIAALHVAPLVVTLDLLAVDRPGEHQVVGTVLPKVQHDRLIRLVVLDLDAVIVDLVDVDGDVAGRNLGDEARLVTNPVGDRDVGPRRRRRLLQRRFFAVDGE